MNASAMIEMIEKLLIGVAIVLFIAGTWLQFQHIWSDCLNENSFFTCVRMLNK